MTVVLISKRDQQNSELVTLAGLKYVLSGLRLTGTLSPVREELSTFTRESSA